MDPYTNALEYLQNLEFIPIATLPSHRSVSESRDRCREAELTSSEQSWPYTFQPEDRAWAKGDNRKWRRVKIVDVGTPEKRENYVALWYIASWKHEGVEFTKEFCPVDGRLKPISPSVTKLLREEGVQFQGAIEDEEEEAVDDHGIRCVIC